MGLVLAAITIWQESRPVTAQAPASDRLGCRSAAVDRHLRVADLVMPRATDGRGRVHYIA